MAIHDVPAMSMHMPQHSLKPAMVEEAVQRGDLTLVRAVRC